MSGDDDGAGGVVDEVGGFRQVGDDVGGEGRVARVRGGVVGVVEVGQFQLYVAGDVDEDRAGASFPGHAEGVFDGTGQVGGGEDEVGAFGADGGDGADVAFLEGFGAQGGAGDLSGDGDQGHAVGFGAHNAGDEVGGAGAGGGHADAGLAGDAGVAVGGVGGGLLVPDEDVAQLRVGPQGVVERQDGAAGVSEQDLNALAQQAFADDFRAFEFHGWVSILPVVAWPAGLGDGVG